MRVNIGELDRNYAVFKLFDSLADDNAYAPSDKILAHAPNGKKPATMLKRTTPSPNGRNTPKASLLNRGTPLLKMIRCR